jgi:hypothetical protein
MFYSDVDREESQLTVHIYDKECSGNGVDEDFLGQITVEKPVEQMVKCD